jgi:hypothetical protein
VESDIVERAEAAWQAGSDEVAIVAKLPAATSESGAGGVLVIRDAVVQRGALQEPTTELARMLGMLRSSIAATSEAGAALAPADLNLTTQTEAVEGQTRAVRGMREKFQATWGIGAG